MSTLSLFSSLPVVTSEAGLSRYLTNIRKFPLLEAAEEAAYARCWREHGDREAAYRLVTSHLRLAAKIAMRYRGYGLPVADLISEANVGLMVAVRKFDPDKGFRLATYAVWWIKATVQEYVLRSWSLVRLGTTPAQKKLFFNLRKLKARLGAGEDGDLSSSQAEEIAAHLSVERRDVYEMNGRLRGDLSLNVPVTDDGSSEEMIDLLADGSGDPETTLADVQERERRREALGRGLVALPDRERRIVAARFMAEDAKTLDELAAEFGISRERVRQLEQRALEKLRMAMNSEMAAASGPAAHGIAEEVRSSPARAARARRRAS
ncbi:RNA polymerase sigma factor RpoH [Bradyrhizobium sp. 18BD]